MGKILNLKFYSALILKYLGVPFLILGMIILLVLISIPGKLLAQEEPSECVEMGGLAYDNWTADDSGGSGMPDGEDDSDYVRCKACHGWDHLGTDGGYVRRSRNDGRPNAGAGDGDQTSRNISFDAREGAAVTADMILHAGTGRSFEDGSGSWVPLDDPASPENKADHAAGYTLGNQHPDISTGGANGMTQEQADCLAEFLNFADGAPSAYFDAINTGLNPALYTIRADADADRGGAFYTDVCFLCHGDPATDHQGLNGGEPPGGILEYLTNDGKYSELASKVRWGYPDEIMTRDTLGDPTSLLTADVMLYLQELGGTGFFLSAGLNGSWYNAERDGEGFNIEIVDDLAGGLRMVAYFYTYDDMGNQIFLVGVGPVDGDMALLDVSITDSGLWGEDFDKDLVERADWGMGTFIAESCGAMSFMLMPNEAMQGMGYTDLEYDLVRLTTPAMECP